MVEPEVAFMEFAELGPLAEEFVVYLVSRVLERCAEPLKVLERDTSKLAWVTAPFPRITYRQAVELLSEKGSEIRYGDDFGAEHETELTRELDRPVMVTHFPAAIKAFYMEPDPESPELALGLDVLAPEGYGEIIGGSQRIHDHDLLLARIQEHDLPVEAFQWYLDIRKYGTVPHAGFGLGFERTIQYATGMANIRDVIPFPRTPKNAEF